VKVTSGNNEVTIKPGQQAILTQNAQLTTDNSPDLNQVMAWKNGEFIMNNSGIDAVMRQISRWYDVDISYKNGIPAGLLSGDIPRNMDLSKMLEVMKLSGVQYTIDGRKVIVSK
jgi:ferric-dicitrate binding protein FerR (iron transport regulator)